MYYTDPYDQSLVFTGFEQGIADSPYMGLSDMRCVNTISIPGEVSVGFSTTAITPPQMTGTVTSANAGTDVITFNSLPNLEVAMAITFSASTIGGVSTNTTYWVGNVTSTTAKLYSDYLLVNVVDITLSGTGTFTIIPLGKLLYFTYDDLGVVYGLDANGRAWTSNQTGPSGYWTYMGNKPNNNSFGNGIVSYTASNNADRYLFVFSGSSIDYIHNPQVATTWTYQWNPATGATGAYSATPTRILKAISTYSGSHEAMVMPTNQVCFCDMNWIGRFYETDPSVAFDPTNTATYIFDQTSLLPATDTAQCLAYLGTSIMVGGQRNVIYPWNGVATTFSYPILLAESNIQKMITVNTNTFALVGSRGRIYVTNGTNANLYKKIPDHISGVTEPYFTWGGITSYKNQLYIGVKATVNGTGAAINQYGGVWAIDMDTKALRLTHKLSHNTYAGYASAIVPNYASNSPSGTGLFIGWTDNGLDASANFGLDKTSGNPYSGGQSTIDTDLAPVGTLENPRDFARIEYKLRRPLVAGESVAIKSRTVFNTTDTGWDTVTTLTSNTGDYSGVGYANFKNAQWLQFQIVLTSTNTNPSFVPLKEIRVKGVKKPIAGNIPVKPS